MQESYEVNEGGIYSHFRGIDNLRKSIEGNPQRNPKHGVLDLLKKLHELNSMQVFANLDGNLIHNFYWMLVVSRDDLRQTSDLIKEAVRERNLLAFAYPDDHDRKEYHAEVASSYFPVQFTKLFQILKGAWIATKSNVMRLRDLVATLALETQYEPWLALGLLEKLLVTLKEHSLLTTANLQVIIQNRTFAKDEMTIHGIPGRKVLPMLNLKQSLQTLFADKLKSPEVKQIIFNILTNVEKPQNVAAVIAALRTHIPRHAAVLKRLLEPTNLAVLNAIFAYNPAMSDAEQVAFAKRVDNLFAEDPAWSSEGSKAKHGFYALLKAGFLNPDTSPANILFMLNSRQLFKHLEGIALLAADGYLTANYCGYVLCAHRPLEKAQCLGWYETVKDSIPGTHLELFKEIFQVACFRLELFIACVDLHRKSLLNDEIMTLIFDNWLCILNREDFKDTLQRCMGTKDSTSLKGCLVNSSPNTTAKHWQSPLTLLGGGSKELDSDDLAISAGEYEGISAQHT